MSSRSFLGPVILALYFLCDLTLGYRLPVDEVFRGELQKRDEICVENDALLSFQEYSEDSVPFCIDYLTIGISTSTLSITGRRSACLCPMLVPSC